MSTPACTNCGAPITAMRGGRFCMLPACRRAYQHEYEANQRKRPGRVSANVAMDKGTPRSGELPCVVCALRAAVELIVGEQAAAGICATCRDNIARACDHFGGYVGAWRIIPIVSIPPEVLEQARAG